MIIEQGVTKPGIYYSNVGYFKAWVNYIYMSSQVFFNLNKKPR